MMYLTMSLYRLNLFLSDDVLDEPFDVLLLDVVPLDDVLPLLEADVPLPVLPVADHDWLFDDVLFSSLGDVSIDNSGVCTGSSLTAGVAITLGVDTTATDGAGVSSILFPPLTLEHNTHLFRQQQLQEHKLHR